ncbi:MAG: SigE family RNA polymerase sigma factor [Sporichthyaceae bacterium]
MMSGAFNRAGGAVSDESGFSPYMAARWPALVRSAVLLGSSRHEAEDLAQTTLIRCYTAWNRVEAAADPDAYVYKVLVNSLASSRRRRWWGERPTADVPVADTSPDAADDLATRDALLAALAELPTTQRQVLVLRYYADLTESQVARVLGVAVGTVKSRASRGLKHLAESPHLNSTNGTIGDARRPR